MLDHLDAIGDARLAIGERQLAQLPGAPVDAVPDTDDVGDPLCRIEARLVPVDGDDLGGGVERKGDGEPAIAGSDIRDYILGAEAREGAERLDITAPVIVDGAVEIDVTVDAARKMRDGADCLRLVGGDGTDQCHARSCCAYSPATKG